MFTPRRRLRATPRPLLSSVLTAVLVAAASAAPAAPPPGHPSPADAYELMQSGQAPRPPAPAHVAKVVNAIDANDYTYIEVSEGDRTHWIAGPKTALSAGDTVRFDDGVIMTDFYSKLLKRTFPSVMFVSNVVVAPQEN